MHLNLITNFFFNSFIQGWSVSLLKEELNNYDFSTKSNSAPEIIPLLAPTLLLH